MPEDPELGLKTRVWRVTFELGPVGGDDEAGAGANCRLLLKFAQQLYQAGQAQGWPAGESFPRAVGRGEDGVDGETSLAGDIGIGVGDDECDTRGLQVCGPLGVTGEEHLGGSGLLQG